MKKKIISLITLLLAASLVASCNGTTQRSSVTPSSKEIEGSSQLPSTSENSDSVIPSNSNNYDGGSSSTNSSSEEPISSSIQPISYSSEIISSSINNSSSEQPIVIEETLDYFIAKFAEDLDVFVPSLDKYNLEYSIFYYYYYEEYYISAMGEDLDGSLLEEYLACFDDTTGLITDEENYPVDSYGYVYTSTDGMFFVNFYDEDGTFYFSVTRYDGGYGSLDVSEIDTNWYVDYYNIQGMDLVDNFPAGDLKAVFNLPIVFSIPMLEADIYPVYYQEVSAQSPATYYTVLQGDQMEDYVDLLDKAGYHATLIEKVGQTIDWDTYELVEYNYYVAEAYDAAKNIFIYMEIDEYENTFISFNKFDDVYSSIRTINTDWTDEEKTIMENTLGYVVPFMAFGDNYEVYDDSDEDWNIVIIEDTFMEDLSNEYIAVLLEAGFKEDSVTWDSTCYYYDNGTVYIEIFIDYDGGHYLEIYSEESHLEPLTGLALNETSLDIVSGASFQLTPIYTPKEATHPLVWSSSNENVATVSKNGLVSINENAEAEASVTITATTPGNISASCAFTIKANTVTGIKYEKDSYVISAGETIHPQYVLLPYGVTSSEVVTYSIQSEGENTSLAYNENGDLTASESAVAGFTASIIATLNADIKATASVTVAAPTTHTLTRELFGIQKADYSKYLDYEVTTEDGAVYQAHAAGNYGLQIRSKSSDSGVIGHFEGRSCKSITFTIDGNTYQTKQVDIYASNEPFSIEDMYNSSFKPVASINYNQDNATTYTQTYTFTDSYSYIGFRSNDGAIYLSSVAIVW